MANKKTGITISACECEHAVHFDFEKVRPNGYPGHRYGAKFNVKTLKMIETAMGKFKICKPCQQSCHPN